MTIRVVVTGMGTVSPLGLNVADTWAGLVAGRSAVGPITQFDASDFPTRIAASVKGFDPSAFMDVKEARRSALHIQYSVAALAEARRQAGLDMTQEDPTRVGVSFGSALGGIPTIEEQIHVLRDQGLRRVNPTLAPAVLINMPACYLAISLGAKGPTHAPVAACATGTTAIGEAARLLQRGDVDVMITGGAESTTTPIGLASFGRLGALSTRNDDPENACRPFDKERDGTVMGEGAAVLILETLEHAQRRGATILAEVVGYGVTEDAFHIVMPEPSGEGAARSMTLAMREAGWSPADVDYICAHGTGTPLNDAAETKAIKLALGPHAYKVPISSNKSMVGHLMGAAGAFSAVVVVKTILEGVISPTSNLRTPDPECDLDYVPRTARRAPVRCALVNAFGFGGQNATLAIQGWAG
jgi:3-oxoacyl-[acyl-carrier-protein] synthase II